MQTSSQPKLLPVPFADAGSKQNIPNDSQIGITAGRASYTDGFPPLTRTPLAAGGVPPFGTDFNGVLNDITAALRWSQSGAGYPFNAAFNTAIAGYPKGAKIPNSTLDGYWLNTTDGNTANPEVTGAATTGWVPAENYGVTGITGLSGSSVTLTTLQASKERITLAGTLSANINLVLPAWIKRWIVVNNCTGNFSVTVKTPNGSGVSIPNGSTVPVSGDGTNIYRDDTTGSLIGVQKLTGSGTYTPTPGTKKIIVELVGGGGAGGGAFAGSNTTSSAGAGGSSGAYGKARITAVAASVNYAVGGGGVAHSGGKGSDGGATTFGSLSVSGGLGGRASSYSGASTYTDVTSGTSNFVGDFIEAITGGYSSIGLMLSSTFCFGGGGGHSKIGTGGAVSGLNTAGSSSAGASPSATNYGAGGGGGVSTSATAVPGGNGADGIILVWEYA